jgi:hypothetical protein
VGANTRSMPLCEPVTILSAAHTHTHHSMRSELSVKLRMDECHDSEAHLPWESHCPGSRWPCYPSRTLLLVRTILEWTTTHLAGIRSCLGAGVNSEPDSAPERRVSGAGRCCRCRSSSLHYEMLNGVEGVMGAEQRIQIQ